MENNIKLNISSDGSEALRIGDAKAKEVPKFYLTSTLLSTAKEYKMPPLNKACLEEFYFKVTGKKDILDKPAPTKTILPFNWTPDLELFYIPLEGEEDIIKPELRELNTGTDYAFEVQQFFNYVKFNLDPQTVLKDKQTSIMAFLNPDLNTFQKRLATNLFIYRCKQLQTYPEFYDEQLLRTYESAGLLPLCWAEIWSAIENKTMAGVCPYCWSVYEIKPHGTRRSTCGSEKCKYAHISEQRGTVRKNRGTKESPGRPHSKQAEQAWELIKEGYEPKDIAEIMGVYKSKVERWLNLKSKA